MAKVEVCLAFAALNFTTDPAVRSSANLVYPSHDCDRLFVPSPLLAAFEDKKIRERPMWAGSVSPRSQFSALGKPLESWDLSSNNSIIRKVFNGEGIQRIVVLA